jgi:ATP-dependent DNA helicase DinG
VFVLLDSGLPSRLTSAFPEGVVPIRTGLAEAVRLVKEFLASTQSA